MFLLVSGIFVIRYRFTYHTLSALKVVQAQHYPLHLMSIPNLKEYGAHMLEKHSSFATTEVA